MAILWQYYGTMTARRFFATMIDMRLKSNQYMLRVHLGYSDGPNFKKSERLKMVGVLEIFTIDYGTWDAWSYNVTRETLQTLCHSKNAPIHDSIRLQTSLVMSKGGSKRMEMEMEMSQFHFSENEVVTFWSKAMSKLSSIELRSKDVMIADIIGGWELTSLSLGSSVAVRGLSRSLSWDQ